MTELERLKRSLRARLIGSEVDTAVKTETLLAILERCRPSAYASDAHLLLQNYSLIGRTNDAREAAFLQKARIGLRPCRSKQNWLRLLERYSQIEQAYRLYSVTEKKVGSDTVWEYERNKAVEAEPERADTYISHIAAYREQRRPQKLAENGKYTFYIEGSDEPDVVVDIPELEAAAREEEAPKGKRERICVTIEELLSAAKEMAELEDGDHCYAVLKTNHIKEVCGNEVKPAEKLDISEAVHLVGMVGAGKSTLMKALTYHLAKQHKKIVLVLDTVTEVFNTVAYFRKRGVAASPLIGRGDREKYIDQLSRDGEMYLDPLYSQYLTTPCIISGMAETDGAVPKHGDEPCRRLKRGKNFFICPYIDICPTTKMYREVVECDVIITTVQGFAAAKPPDSGRLFFEYVLEQADLVVFDECDRVQKTLDEFYTPCTDFTDFLKKSADDIARDNREDIESQDAMGENERNYSTLRGRSREAAMVVRLAIESINDEWEYMLRDTFSAMTLYQQLCYDSEKKIDSLKKRIAKAEKDGETPVRIKALKKSLERAEKLYIPHELLETLESAMDMTGDDEFKMLCLCALSESDKELFTQLLKNWLSKNGCDAEKELLEHIKLYVILTQFDRHIKALDASYAYLSDAQKTETELFDFLLARYTLQQNYLPSAVMGNLFGMRNDPKKGLQLYRQYAFGRALMDRLSYLRLEEDGSPAGPHVLMMSGSSWAKGCLEYHVNVPVKYIIEADTWVREKLSRTKMTDLCTGVCVSGSPVDKRVENLGLVIRKSLDTVTAELDKGRKVLMIVNSYDEAKIAAEELNSVLKKARTAYLVRQSDAEEHGTQVLRANVGGFDSHKAEILVAPAQAIERGYNIVDIAGNSVFGSIFFLVRPMPVPNEIALKCAKLNGIIEEKAIRDGTLCGFEKAKLLRQEATKQWHVMETESKKMLKYLHEPFRTDVTASLFVLILQLFGRLARITDENRDAPAVYFADGAFRAREGSRGGYDSLNELRYYLQNMMDSAESGAAAASLYGPFYKAFMKGVPENVFTDIPDGDDPEDEFDL